MAKEFNRLDRIPAEQLTAYERWELPVMDSAGNEQVRQSRVEPVDVEEEIQVKPLTAQDLEEIRQAAWLEGQQEGFQAGHSEGFEQGRQEGHGEGFAQGKAEGEQAGADSKREEIDAALKRLEAIGSELMEPIRKQQDEIEQALLNLALAVTRSVIRREISLDSQQIRKVVQEALNALPRTSEHIRLHVNPQDAGYVKELAAQQQESWTIVEAPEVMAGGCKVETRYSMIDYTVEKRFQLAVQQMLDKHTAVQPAQAVVATSEIMGDMSDFHRELLETTVPAVNLEAPPVVPAADDSAPQPADPESPYDPLNPV